ncbi:putative Clock controled protein [Taphrina deformans PYCC 5710]|uniref:Clock controled protein n=1 Tax=Taphrina deformans (strain PYCC 5710 / ATCC 11124 / CBS 356.35 / IMI 108563 / JCM 9778 / NBRC 8474) TaxID=1097556 RepID=R4XA42_TAPDE|nr:putative Clock controled protein [Taphrina deformans PYCC 5710]|eukprot:CCG82612.1 putative Clock controled protein [Taphrina deformans PYCC 5710]
MAQDYESGITLEDPEVRLAAEVLGTLHRSGGGDPSNSPAFLNRVSEYPIVSTAVRAYENGKSHSKGFKYAAQTIESVALPVVRRFETLDEFACRQLDRIERKYNPHEDLEAQSAAKRKFPAEEDEVMHDYTRHARTSKWQDVLTGASGLTLSLSEDSLKSLRYCVEWLQWANTHVGGLLGGLRNIDCHGQVRNMTYTDRTDLANNISHAKREIAETLKKLVTIVSNYAGTALPEAARSRVRGFVLGMPGRWAARQSDSSSPYPVEKMDASEEIEREYTSVTSLASESLEVLQNVSEIITRTLEKTQDWVSWRLNRPVKHGQLEGGNWEKQQQLQDTPPLQHSDPPPMYN